MFFRETENSFRLGNANEDYSTTSSRILVLRKDKRASAYDSFGPFFAHSPTTTPSPSFSPHDYEPMAFLPWFDVIASFASELSLLPDDCHFNLSNSRIAYTYNASRAFSKEEKKTQRNFPDVPTVYYNNYVYVSTKGGASRVNFSYTRS